MAKLTKKDIKAAAAKAAKRAGERGKELAAKAAERASDLNAKLRTTKHRRLVDGGEVFGGAVIAGVMHGYDVSWKYGAEYAADGKTITNPADVTEVPAGVIVGVAGLGLGMVTKSYDLQATSLGALAFGAGRMAEDYARSMAEQA